MFRDIAEHERQHKNFFKRALQVLRAARTFEDLGVAAYNGAGSRVRLAEFLTIAGKIVSVEARHAAAIRDLIDPGSRAFAGDDVIDAMGMDRAMAPGEVLERAQPFFRGTLRVVNL